MDEQSSSMKPVADRMIQAVRGYVERALSPVSNRLATVETRCGALSLMMARGSEGKSLDVVEDVLLRLKALEERSPLSYGGVWVDRQSSFAGVFYTDKGSIWHCNETTLDRPGTSAAFTLACKRGGDR